MRRQSTSSLVMVPPEHFGFNPQTAVTNPFQHSLDIAKDEIRNAVLSEFTTMVNTLQKEDITVTLLPNRLDVMTPDAVYPNNWFSHHADGILVLYPMMSPNRRLERQKDALVQLLTNTGVKVSKIIDLTNDEEKGLFLESTGSMVFDRVNKVAFAMSSPRTVKEEFDKWCKVMDYEGVWLQSTSHHVKTVYHTNINMSIGTEFAVVCFEVIEDKKEKDKLRKKLENLGKKIIEISLEQVYQFCGNIFELSTRSGEKLIVMSETAYKSFKPEQLTVLNHFGKILSFAIPTIETVGGGGVRCMIAEIFPQTINENQ